MLGGGLVLGGWVVLLHCIVRAAVRVPQEAALILQCSLHFYAPSVLLLLQYLWAGKDIYQINHRLLNSVCRPKQGQLPFAFCFLDLCLLVAGSHTAWQ